MSQLFVDTIRNRDGNGAPIFDKGIVISGIITASGSLGGESVSIGLTEVISSAFQLKNVLSLDAITTASIEAAVSAAPNDFTSLNVSGISTFGNDVDLNANIDILGHTEINTLNASGILTATVLSTGAEGSAIRISSNTISGPATLTIDPAGIGTNTGTVVIQGDLQVEGDTTTVNSTTLTIDDKNIILASGSLTDASSDGGGITLESGEGNKTINWVNSTDSWTFSENIDLASGKTFKINGVDILSATTLGSSVVNSSITSLGSLTALNVTGDLDVDGHTNLDNVSIAGVVTATTFVGDGDFVELDVDGHTNLDNVSIAGVVTATTFVGNGDFVDIDVDGHTNLDNVSIAGVTTGTTINATTFVGNGDFVDIDVDGHTNLDNVSVAGVSTFTGAITANGAIDLNADLDVDGHTNLDNVTVGGAITATTFTGDLSGEVNTAAQPNITSLGTLTGLTVSGNITAQADLDVDGHTNLDNVSIAGVTTFASDANINGLTVGRGAADVSTNTAIGSGALGSNTTNGEYSTAIGVNALGLSTSGSANVAVGNNALYSNTPGGGSMNVAIGNDALYTNSSGQGNTAVGRDALRANTTGGDNIGVGVNASLENTEGDHNVAIGNGALNNNTVGSYNIAIGENAGSQLRGSNNTIIGSIPGTSTLSGTVIIGAGVTERLRITSDGSVGIGTTNPIAKLDVAGNLNTLTFRAGLSTFTGFVYNELDTNTSLRNNAADFNNIAGVAFTSGSTDTLYWDFATAPSVIGGEASNGIENIELAGLPTNSKYMVRATLITYTNNSNDWNTGNVVVKVNGQTPTNYLWRNGAQPVGTTTGSSNAFDIVEFKIVHDTNNEFSVFAEWSAYHAST